MYRRTYTCPRYCSTFLSTSLVVVVHRLYSMHTLSLFIVMQALVPAANAFAAPFREAVEAHDHDAAAEFARFVVLLADNHIKVRFAPFCLCV